MHFVKACYKIQFKNGKKKYLSNECNNKNELNSQNVQTKWKILKCIKSQIDETRRHTVAKTLAVLYEILGHHGV